MHFVRVATACVLVLAIVGTAQATSLLPLTPATNESGFGTLYQSLTSPYTGSGFSGTLYSRVYVDATPANHVTFVFDLHVQTARTVVEDMSIAAVGSENDLRIGEIIAGINGYVSSTTDKIPNSADAFDNEYPESDEVLYGWDGTNRLRSGDDAVMYVTTTGAVDVGVVSVAIQDGSTADAEVLAPVDNPDAPDMNVPEPASLALLALGAMFIRRR